MSAKGKSDGERPRQRRMRAPARRAHILTTALDVFAERGYEASMGELAEASGVTRTVLYYYFPSKKDLFLAVLDTQVTELIAHLAPVAAGEGTQEERMRQTLDAVLTFAEQHPAAWEVLFRHSDEAEPEVVEVRVGVHEAMMVAGATLMAAEAEDLGVDPATPRARVMAELMMGGVLSVVQWWRANPSVPRDEVLDAMADFGWGGINGLAAEKSGAKRARRRPRGAAA